MSIRVMIVDDSRFAYEEIRFLLEDTDYEVVRYCKDGEEAVTEYGNVLPDLVTMDIILPGIDGFECARQILKGHPEANIVMVSSLAYDETVREAKALGIEEFLFKPIERDSLVDTLNRAIAGKEVYT